MTPRPVVLCALLVSAFGMAPLVANAQGKAPATKPMVGQAIPDRYIVVLQPRVANPGAEARAMAAAAGGQVERVFSTALKGFSARLPAVAVSRLAQNPNVLSIEPDRVIGLAAGSQNNAPWGLDRIDQVDRPLSTTYDYLATGAGVRAYIIDTGIRASHSDFGGRTLPGFTAISDGNGSNDCNGHGTHVAATVGGSQWGVAKAAALVPVRVLGCDGSGSYSGVIAGVDWAAAQTHRPAVANLSLGGPTSDALDQAIAGATASGLSMVVAAGNSNADACNYSPARAPSAITVGATTSSDARANYSNFGPCLDLFAPGSAITSAWYTSDFASASLNGTSMAAPHVAGVVALVLEKNPNASAASVTELLLGTASVNKLSSIGRRSPNLLVYSLGMGDVVEPALSSVAVGAMSGAVQLQRNGWQALATVSVRDVESGAAVSGAQVSVGFNPGGSASCTTGSSGSCTATSSRLSNKASSTEASVTGVSGNAMQYERSQNSVTSIRISR